MVEYYVYGYILKSNKDLHMLTPYTGQANQGEIKLNIKINDIWNRTNNNPNISVQYKKNEVVLDIGKMVEYRIYYTENQIFVDATDFAWVESTFLNLPFALFFSQKNMLLLHASCLSIGKIIVPLCAPKGTGKTTATVGLSKFYNFYSDDTVLLRLENGNVLGYYGTRLVKLTKDSYDYLISDDGFEVLSKNLQGKAYFEVHENAEIDLEHANAEIKLIGKQEDYQIMHKKQEGRTFIAGQEILSENEAIGNGNAKIKLETKYTNTNVNFE